MEYLQKVCIVGVFVTFFSLYILDGSERQFEIYKTDVTTPGFVDWHQQLETFVLWYIDAASYIDTDDDRWTFYLL